MDATKVELTIKGDVERLELKSTDFLVVSFKNLPEPGCVKSIIRDMSDRFGIPTSRIIIACDGVRLSVIDKSGIG